MRFVRNMDLPQRNPDNHRKKHSMIETGSGQEGNPYSRFLSNQAQETMSIVDVAR